MTTRGAGSRSGAPADAERALKLRRAGLLEDARDAFLKAIGGKSAAPAWVYAAAGETFRQLGSRRRGYALIQESLRRDPRAVFAARLKPEGGRLDAWLHGCAGGALRLAGKLDDARAPLERALELDPGCGWAWGWLGEISLRQGRHDEALGQLQRAAALFAEWPEVHVWRGETLRALGRLDEARRDLDHAVALGYAGYDVFLSRAAICQAQGDAEGHLRELSAAVRAAPKVFREQAAAGGEAGDWIESVLAAERKALKTLERAKQALESGKPEAALEAALKAAQEDPTASEALEMSSRAQGRLGRLEEALQSAQRAAQLRPSAASYALRADAAQRAGYMEAALRDLTLAIALSPSAELHQWRARNFLGMRHYDLALRDIAEALTIDPSSAALYDLRSQVNLILGRLGDAQRDLERALALMPRQVNLRLRLAQLLALRGKFDEALESVAPIRRSSPAWARFISGYVRCMRKEYPAAADDFAASAKQAKAGDGGLERQAAIFGTVARAVGALQTYKDDGGDMAKSARKDKNRGGPREKGKVYLCGLGVYPPQTATIEVLKGVSECDVIFNNLPGLGMSEFLGLFCANRRPVAFRYEQDAKLCADLVLSEVKPGRTVGFVTFGHPLLFGPLSHEIIKRCAAEGIPCKAFGAVSSMDAVLAASGQVLGYSYPGLQVFETTGGRVLEHIGSANPSLPAVIYFAEGLGEAGLQQLVGALSKLYSPDHECLLYGPRHELWETDRETATLRGLTKMSHHKLAQGILFVPPK